MFSFYNLNFYKEGIYTNILLYTSLGILDNPLPPAIFLVENEYNIHITYNQHD